MGYESKSESDAGAIFPPFDLAGQQTEVLQPKRRYWTKRSLAPGLPNYCIFINIAMIMIMNLKPPQGRVFLLSSFSSVFSSHHTGPYFCFVIFFIIVVNIFFLSS